MEGAKTVFYPETGQLILWLENIPVEPKKRDFARVNGLFPKEKFHVTIMGTATWKEFLKFIEKQGINEKAKYLSELQTLWESINWKLSLKDEFYSVEKIIEDPWEKRESVIQMVELEGVSEFYKGLNALLDTRFELPVPHITLYTKSTREDKMLWGIGLYSWEDFYALNPRLL